MKQILIIILIIFVVLGIHLYKKNQQSYFDSDPVKPSETNFSNLASESLYKECVVQNNLQIKKFIDNGRVAKEKYPDMLTQIKQSCHCFATDKNLLQVQEQHPHHSRPHINAINQAMRRCIKAIEIRK